MFRPGTVNEADYSPQEPTPAPQQRPQPRGRIQKISQEGSKNTYVIIVNKDCIKSQSSQGPPVIKHRSTTPCESFGQTSSSVKSNLSRLSACDNDFDSPTGDVVVKSRPFPHEKTEDVRLNLSNINDDEYDSNLSAAKVFLKPEPAFGPTANDSAIDVELPSSFSRLPSSNNSRSYFCPKSKMNSYVVQKPMPIQQPKEYACLEQHTFPMISPQLVGNKQAMAYSAPVMKERQQPPARKIFLVTPSPTQTDGAGFQKSVAYTNEAVPMMGKSKVSSLNSPATLPSKLNPKAVPTFNNISPITQQGTSRSSPSGFVPNSYGESPVLGARAQTSHSPLTSTPIVGQHLRPETSSHRPMYMLQQPFSLQNVAYSSAPTIDTQSSNCESPVIVIQPLSTSTLNNSSGFVSGSSSLEAPDASGSFDAQHTSFDKRAVSDNVKTTVIEIACTDDKSKLPLFNEGAMEDSLDGFPEAVKFANDEDLMDLGVDSEMDPTSSQESAASDSSEKGVLDTSLTNIQWLKGMQLKEDKSTLVTNNTTTQSQQQQMVHWKSLSPDEMQRMISECSIDKRPSFSYMSMIQMALYSREDNKMMLKEICQWIEETFPYYKYTAKPGWRNSIRHNLSLYNIFERESSKRHGSYWTIKPDMEPRTKQYKQSNSSSSTRTSSGGDVHRSTPSLSSQASGGVIPIIPMYSSMGQLSAITPQQVCVGQQSTRSSRKKGPPPILPRPSPYSANTPQAYALIPINNGSPVASLGMPSPQQPVLVNLANTGGTGSACPSPGITEMSAAVASIQMSCASPIPTDSCEAPFQETKYKKTPVNIVKQAWIESQAVETASSLESDPRTSNDLASSSEITSSSEFTTGRVKSKRPRNRACLPKPTIYQEQTNRIKLTGSKRRKLQQKERSLMEESSEDEDVGAKFISSLEKDLTAPIKLGDGPEHVGHILKTSTPLKKREPASTELPSPIGGLTPLRNNSLFEGSFLDTLADRKALGLSPDILVSKKFSPNLNDSPNSSLLDFNVIPFGGAEKLEGSPDSNTSLSNQNLSRFLSEYGLDPNLAENPENFPNLNWSSIQHMMDSMDTT